MPLLTPDEVLDIAFENPNTMDDSFIRAELIEEHEVGTIKHLLGDDTYTELVGGDYAGALDSVEAWLAYEVKAAAIPLLKNVPDGIGVTGEYQANPDAARQAIAQARESARFHMLAAREWLNDNGVDHNIDTTSRIAGAIII